MTVDETVKPVWVKSEEVMRMLNCSRGALSGLQKREDFPKPIRISFYVVRWKAEEIRQWAEAQRQGENNARH